LEKRPDKILSPRIAVFLRGCQIGSRKSAPHPEPGEILAANLVDAKAREIDKLDSAG
jgi:hypothetical protein